MNVNHLAIAPQGEGGYDQCWYAVARSEEVGTAQAIGKDFLHGRIAVFRGNDGNAQVVSAYCPHLGADLSLGTVIENQIRCSFHHWRFDRSGQCVGCPAAKEPPREANVYSFPTTEAYGLIWAFNGDAARFPRPKFEGYEDDALAYRVVELTDQFAVDPYVLVSNTIDFQHLRVVHGFKFPQKLPDIIMGDGSYAYDLTIESSEIGRFPMRVQVFGTNTLMIRGELAGEVIFIAATAAPGAPGKTRAYYYALTPKRDGEELAAQEARVEKAAFFAHYLIEEDLPILKSIRFRPDNLLDEEADAALRDYLDYVRQYPRSSAAIPFVR